MVTLFAPPLATRVLVIEDHPDSRESLRLLLSLHGCDVRVAADGSEGLRQALEWRPDVIISDIGLPAMDGWEVGRHVRAALGEAVFLIAVTGYGQPSDYERSFAEGFNAHLTKPADLAKLLTLLHHRSGAGAVE
jgi:CheY-like chemotaxis protein